MLDAKEIQADIFKIAKDWQAKSKKFQESKVKKNCMLDHGVLHYDNAEFHKGDCVIITSAVTSSKFYGTIVALNPAEVVNYTHIPR